MVAKTKKEKARELNAKRLEELHSEIASAVEAMNEPESWRQWLDVAAQLPQYSFNNQIALMKQAEARNISARAFASFSRWKDAGYSVNKGEKAFRILAPLKFKTPFDKESGERISKEEANQKPKSAVVWKQAVVGYKAVPTFEISQTSAADLGTIPDEMVPAELQGPAPDGMIDSFVQFARSHGANVEFVPLDTLDGAKGRFLPSTKKIEVGQELSDAAKAKTLVHECAHLFLHGDNPSELSRSVKEIEAESTAYVVSKRLGLDTSDYSFKYVSGWSGFDAEAVRQTGERVVKAAETMLTETSVVDSPSRHSDSERSAIVSASAELTTPTRKPKQSSMSILMSKQTFRNPKALNFSAHQPVQPRGLKQSDRGLNL